MNNKYSFEVLLKYIVYYFNMHDIFHSDSKYWYDEININPFKKSDDYE